VARKTAAMARVIRCKIFALGWSYRRRKVRNLINFIVRAANEDHVLDFCRTPFLFTSIDIKELLQLAL
jgi:hypothetical protein